MMTLRLACSLPLLLLLLLLSCVSFARADGDAPDQRVLVRIGLVADNHYDTFPAGEQAPWEKTSSWLIGQQQRTTTTTKRRYDIAKDKMLEAADVFNRAEVDFAVNLGDLINNDLMWNLKPILDAFGAIKAPKFNLIGNHCRRAHNDRFGKNNATQERWLMAKMGVTEWFYAVDYPPHFRFLFLDSMVMEEPEATTPKRRQQLEWLRAELERAKAARRVVLLFAHISIGLATSPFAPVLKAYEEHIVGGFFGHTHKGGYVLQGRQFHTTIIQGQIETLTNAYAVLEMFADRMELTGFGRVPSRVMKFDAATAALLREQIAQDAGTHNTKLAVGGPNQPAPPDRLWPKDEVLQKPPPLNLNIPAYRKPLVAAAEPNPGETRFLKQVYSKWPRRVKTLAPEEPVDLTSFHKQKQRTWMKIENGQHIMLRSGGGVAAADVTAPSQEQEEKTAQWRAKRVTSAADDADSRGPTGQLRDAGANPEFDSVLIGGVLFGIVSVLLVLWLLRTARGGATAVVVAAAQK